MRFYIAIPILACCLSRKTPSHKVIEDCSFINSSKLILILLNSLTCYRATSIAKLQKWPCILQFLQVLMVQLQHSVTVMICCCKTSCIDCCEQFCSSKQQPKAMFQYCHLALYSWALIEVSIYPKGCFNVIFSYTSNKPQFKALSLHSQPQFKVVHLNCIIKSFFPCIGK